MGGRGVEGKWAWDVSGQHGTASHKCVVGDLCGTSALEVIEYGQPDTYLPTYLPTFKA